MKINPIKLAGLKSHYKKFQENHPKVIPFVSYAKDKVEVGDIVEIIIKNDSGKEIKTNIKVTDDDMKFVEAVKEAIK